MYTVVKEFADLEEGGLYKEGDTFPRDGSTASDERILELSTTDNKLGVVLIRKVAKGNRRKGNQK